MKPPTRTGQTFVQRVEVSACHKHKDSLNYRRAMAKYHGKNVAVFRKKNNATLTAMNFLGFPNRSKTTTQNELSNEQDMSLQWRFYFKSVHVLTT